MQNTIKGQWFSICLFWRILGVLNAFKVICMVVSAVETDSAFTFPSVGSVLQRTWKVYLHVFCMYWLKVIALAYFSFLENVD